MTGSIDEILFSFLTSEDMARFSFSHAFPPISNQQLYCMVRPSIKVIRAWGVSRATTPPIHEYSTVIQLDSSNPYCARRNGSRTLPYIWEYKRTEQTGVCPPNVIRVLTANRQRICKLHRRAACALTPYDINSISG